MVVMMWEQEGSRSLVSKLRADGKSHNCAPVKRSADWFVKTSVWSLSFQRYNKTDIYMHFYISVLRCVCLCVQMLFHKGTMKPEPYCSTQSSLVLFSWRDSDVSPLWGQLKKTKPAPKVQPVWSLSAMHLFHYELIRSVQLLFVCCTFKQYKPPESPQDSKVSHTVQQGKHEAIKNNQIKARYSILGIKREFLYYFTVVDAEIRMVVFISCNVNLSLCLETFGLAPWPQIFRGIVSLPCLLCLSVSWLSFSHCLTFISSFGLFYSVDLITASLSLSATVRELQGLSSPVFLELMFKLYMFLGPESTELLSNESVDHLIKQLIVSL